MSAPPLCITTYVLCSIMWYFKNTNKLYTLKWEKITSSAEMNVSLREQLQFHWESFDYDTYVRSWALYRAWKSNGTQRTSITIISPPFFCIKIPGRKKQNISSKMKCNVDHNLWLPLHNKVCLTFEIVNFKY